MTARLVPSAPPTPPAPPVRSRTGEAALSGVAAGALAFGVGQGAAAFTGGGSPASALGSATVDATPAWLKDAVIAAVGTHDKLVLRGVLVLVVVALAAACGALERRRRGTGRALVAVLGALALAAALTRSGAGALQAVPTVVGFALGAWALRALVDRTRPGWRSRSPRSAGADPGRRAVLAGSAAAVLAGLAATAVGHLASGAARGAAAARSALRLPRPAVRAPAVPAGVDPRAPGQTRYLPATGDFYRIDTALSVPRIDPAGWSLRVHGLVGRELHLRFDDLLREDLVAARVTLACVSNEVGGDLVGNATWLGVPVARVLARAGVRAGADMVLSSSSDGFTAATPLDALTDPARGALLAVGMNGAPLPFEHGFPVRMVVPGLYGYVSATKWVTDLRVTRYADATSYWTQRGWAVRAPVKTASRLDVPSDGASVDAGRVTVAGVAWAPTRGISRVEVRVDGGAWRTAELAADGGEDTWRLWTLPWDARRGTHQLTVRATDGTGAVQTSRTAPPAPDGSSGYHSITVHVG